MNSKDLQGADGAFTLDTSGTVLLSAGNLHFPGLERHVGWSELPPFAQGYLEAMLAGRGDGLALWVDAPHNGAWDYRAGFSDLAPETLAMILKDCEDPKDGARGGALFWTMRQRGDFGPNFPPLIPYLGDDGKVRLRGNADTSIPSDPLREASEPNPTRPTS